MANPGDTWREKGLLVWLTLQHVDHTPEPLLHTSGSKRSSRLRKSRNMSAAYKAHDSSRRTKISEVSRSSIGVLRGVDRRSSIPIAEQADYVVYTTLQVWIQQSWMTKTTWEATAWNDQGQVPLDRQGSRSSIGSCGVDHTPDRDPVSVHRVVWTPHWDGPRGNSPRDHKYSLALKAASIHPGSTLFFPSFLLFLELSRRSSDP